MLTGEPVIIEWSKKLAIVNPPFMLADVSRAFHPPPSPPSVIVSIKRNFIGLLFGRSFFALKPDGMSI